MEYEILGYLAGACMAICQFPQAWMIHKTNHTANISIIMEMILTLGTFLWCLCGILNNITSMWLTNAICLIPCIYIIYKSIRNKK